MPENTARLLLVRHGRTSHNVHERLTGWGDPDLDPLGLEQADTVGQHLARVYRPQLLFCSPLRRAYQTAERIGRACGLQPQPVEGLKEVHFGDVEGFTEAELERHFPEIHRHSRDLHDLDFCWPNGESRRAFNARIRGALDEVIARSLGQTAVVATHGGVIANLLSTLERGTSACWPDYLAHNCSVTELETNGECFHIVRFNDVSFLPVAAQTTQFVVQSDGEGARSGVRGGGGG